MKFNFKKKQILFVLGMSLILSTRNIFCVQAVNFKDINQNFWAYKYINHVAEKGLITADAAGYFKPNENINKFDTAKILAKTIGYKYSDLTQEEKYVKPIIEINNQKEHEEKARKTKS